MSESQTMVDQVSVTIDGIEVSVPKGTLVIRAAEQLGIDIPRFCDHPLLDPAGACRQCMVEVPDMGNGRGMPKPQASCTLTVMPGMKVNTHVTSPVADKAQTGIMELLLINHPLDCPICDKGGECPLQNQAMAVGRDSSRYTGAKRTFPKPSTISPLVLLDRERCILCARCTRFSDQISGDPFIALVERGALQQVGRYEDQPYESIFSGNVIQICPVGALTSSDYRFQARPFDLVSVDSSCEHCAAGCSLRVDQRHYQVKRRLAGVDPDVNEEWNCDKGRFAFHYGRGDDRLRTPLVRRDGELVPASWAEAIDVAATGLANAGSSVGVLTGGRLLQEAAYAYSRFARSVLGTNNIDCRSRPMTSEETQFLAHHVAGRSFEDSVTYADLESASSVVLVGFEPEDESPIVFLRLRKAVRKRGLVVKTVGSVLSRGSTKLNAQLIPALPGDEAAALADLPLGPADIVLVGERAATSPGLLSSVSNLHAQTGVRVAWIPRRAGEVGAIDAGCLPTVLPGGHDVSDPAAREHFADVWGSAIPANPGMDGQEMIQSAIAGSLSALVVAGVQPSDWSDPAQVMQALDTVPFVVSLENRLSEVTARASVVFPVALIEEQTGHFVNWEHRARPVRLVNAENSSPMTDIRTLAALSDAMGSELGFRIAKAAIRELTTVPLRSIDTFPTAEWSVTEKLASTGLTLASWRPAVEATSAAVSGVPALVDAQPASTIRMSPITAAELGLNDGQSVRASLGETVCELPLQIDEGILDSVVYVPGYPGLAGSPVTVLATGGAA